MAEAIQEKATLNSTNWPDRRCDVNLSVRIKGKSEKVVITLADLKIARDQLDIALRQARQDFDTAREDFREEGGGRASAAVYPAQEIDLG